MVYSHWLGPEPGPRLVLCRTFHIAHGPGRMGCMVLIKSVHTAPEQVREKHQYSSQGTFSGPEKWVPDPFFRSLKPYNPFFPVPVPVPVPDQASVNTPLVSESVNKPLHLWESAKDLSLIFVAARHGQKNGNPSGGDIVFAFAFAQCKRILNSLTLAHSGYPSFTATSSAVFIPCVATEQFTQQRKTVHLATKNSSPSKEKQFTQQRKTVHLATKTLHLATKTVRLATKIVHLATKNSSPSNKNSSPSNKNSSPSNEKTSVLYV